MASRTSFAKLQRERQKKAKAAAKRARRQGRAEESDDVTQADAAGPPAKDVEELSPHELLHSVESLQSRLASGAISLDEFEEEKAALADRLAATTD